ncbi:MAG: hypothetical protein AAF772_12335 [Acidobacteriota bacterium]
MSSVTSSERVVITQTLPTLLRLVRRGAQRMVDDDGLRENLVQRTLVRWLTEPDVLERLAAQSELAQSREAFRRLTREQRFADEVPQPTEHLYGPSEPHGRRLQVCRALLLLWDDLLGLDDGPRLQLTLFLLGHHQTVDPELPRLVEAAPRTTDDDDDPPTAANDASAVEGDPRHIDGTGPSPETEARWATLTERLEHVVKRCRPIPHNHRDEIIQQVLLGWWRRHCQGNFDAAEAVEAHGAFFYSSLRNAWLDRKRIMTSEDNESLDTSEEAETYLNEWAREADDPFAYETLYNALGAIRQSYRIAIVLDMLGCTTAQTARLWFDAADTRTVRRVESARRNGRMALALALRSLDAEHDAPDDAQIDAIP